MTDIDHLTQTSMLASFDYASLHAHVQMQPVASDHASASHVFSQLLALFITTVISPSAMYTLRKLYTMWS